METMVCNWLKGLAFPRFESSILYVFMMGLILSVFISSCSDGSPKQTKNLYEVNAPSQLILRSEPSMSGQKIVSLPHKAVIEVDNIENGWAHVAWNNHSGYVNADYLIPIYSEGIGEVSDTSKPSSMDSNRNISKIVYDYFPFLIFALFVLAVVFLSRDEDSMNCWWALVAMSICEILYELCASDFFYRFWFLEPSEVGWLWTIVGYALMLGLVIGQGILVVIWVRSTSSGWFNALLTWGSSFMSGICLFLVLMTYDKIELIHIAMALAFVVCLIGIVYYSNRNWSEVWYISLIDMIIISAYLCWLISLLGHIIIGLIGVIVLLIFTTKTSGGSKWFYVEDEYGNKIRLRRTNNPNRAYDSYGKLYELFSDGRWRKA